MDFSTLRHLLMEEYKKHSPTPEELNAFITALVWFEDALVNEKETEEQLMDFLPEKKYNYYLKKSIKGITAVLNENEHLKSELTATRNTLNNIYSNMSKTELKELRKEMKYQKMEEKIKWLEHHRDIFAGLYFGELEKNKKKE